MAANDEEPDTQKLSQLSMDVVLDSQPIELVWGRLYGKRVAIRSLGMRTRPKYVLENSSRTFGINIYL